jgi:hypothetical protein
MGENRSERENYIRHGLIVSCIVCIIGVFFDMNKVALAGGIMLIVVQLVDLIWYFIEIKCKDCENVKQAFCRHKHIQLLNEWSNVDTKFGRCKRCGKYFMINEKMDALVSISEEEYKQHVEVFNMLSKSKKKIEESISELGFNIEDLLKIAEENEKENKE